MILYDYQKAAIAVLSKPGRHILCTKLGEGTAETAFRAIAQYSKEVTIVCPVIVRDFLFRVAIDEGIEDVSVLSPARIRSLCDAEVHWQQSDRPTVIFLTLIPEYKATTKTAKAIASFTASRKSLIIVRYGDWGTEPLGDL